MPRELRSAFKALWNLDLAFADVVATSSDPRLGAIRLAWWRERLEELDGSKKAAAEPRLRAVANELLPHGVGGKELSRLEDAWLPLIEPFPWGEAQALGLRLRGHILFGIGAQVLGGDPRDAEPAGEVWSLIDGAGHCSDPQSRERLVEEAAKVGTPNRAASRIRPLTILTVLAVSDVLNPSSGVARGMVAAGHRLTGRFPRWS